MVHEKSPSLCNAFFVCFDSMLTTSDSSLNCQKYMHTFHKHIYIHEYTYIYIYLKYDIYMSAFDLEMQA